jgi:cell division protein FtsL
MLIKSKVFVLVLPVVFFMSASSVVLNVYEYSTLVSEKNANDQKKDHLNAAWGRLILEYQTLTAPAHIEKLSRSRLGMVSPTKNDVRHLVLNK